MSCKTTHEVRSHRSKRDYKPVNTAMRHIEAKKRKRISKFVGRLVPKGSEL